MNTTKFPIQYRRSDSLKFKHSVNIFKMEQRLQTFILYMRCFPPTSCMKSTHNVYFITVQIIRIFLGNARQKCAGYFLKHSIKK